MLLNTFALTSLFVGAISLLLMAAGAISALYFYRQLKGSERADEKALAENRIHLSFLLVCTAFFLRLIAWPLFYMLLYSFVPLVPGAMCIFGVTRVMPVFVAFLQILKPLAFFLIGGWLILHGLDLSLKTHPLMRKSIRLLAAVSSIAIIDAVAEILFILIFTPPGVAVSCCSAITDIVVPAARLLPIPLFGAQYHHALMACYHAFNLGLVGLIGLLLWCKRAKRDGTFSRPLLALLAFVTFINGMITYGAFKEYIGPRLMGLPKHHCLYCLLQNRPISIVILGLFIVGSFLALWPLLLSYIVSSDEAGERLSAVTRNLLKSAFLCLLASWLLVSPIFAIGG